MKFRRRTSRTSIASFIASVAAAAALGVPGMASADFWQPGIDEGGVVAHPTAFNSDKARAQVSADVEAAARQGLLNFREGSYPPPILRDGPGRTREDVVRELLNETPAERDARMQRYSGG